MKITEETARRVAKLARIAVAAQELPTLAKELSSIVAFMEQLNEVDICDVTPMISVTPYQLFRRQDVVSEANLQREVLQNAPDTREGFYVVPKVVE